MYLSRSSVGGACVNECCAEWMYNGIGMEIFRFSIRLLYVDNRYNLFTEDLSYFSVFWCRAQRAAVCGESIWPRMNEFKSVFCLQSIFLAYFLVCIKSVKAFPSHIRMMCSRILPEIRMNDMLNAISLDFPIDQTKHTWYDVMCSDVWRFAVLKTLTHSPIISLIWNHSKPKKHLMPSNSIK